MSNKKTYYDDYAEMEIFPTPNGAYISIKESPTEPGTGVILQKEDLLELIGDLTNLLKE